MDEVVTFGKLIEYGGYLTGAFAFGFATCKGLDYFLKPKPVTTVKEFCNTPQLKTIHKTKPQEFTKTFINGSGKVVDVSCLHMAKNKICMIDKKKCKHYN